MEAVGEQAGRARRYSVEMVDRYDEARGFTSMARTTAFTARMIGRGDLRFAGARTPEQVIVVPCSTGWWMNWRMRASGST